jgi:hypothetical protein
MEFLKPHSAVVHTQHYPPNSIITIFKHVAETHVFSEYVKYLMSDPSRKASLYPPHRPLEERTQQPGEGLGALAPGSLSN